jgi:hypothetical protein
MRLTAETALAGMRSRPRDRRPLNGLVLCLGLALAGCDRSSSPGSSGGSTSSSSGVPAEVATNLIPLPQADERLCTAVVILIDTSGSMKEAVQDQGGRRQPKYVVAREALTRIVDYTGEWQKAHADQALQIGLFSFNSSASQVLPMGPFDLASTRKAVQSIPHPGGGTAIGEAVEEAFKSLYRSGCVRKHLLCITDGENTVGPPPDRVSRQLFAQTHGEVEMHFVAFDTSAEKFGFLKDVNGHTVEAADGAQLQTRLSDIYEKRILAESPGEKE